MSLHSHMKRLIAVTVIALAAGPAGAQSSGTVGGSANPSPDASGQLTFQGKPRLGAEDQERAADVNIAKMEQTSASIGRRHLRASAQSDVVLANCLKDKLNQADIALRSAKERRLALKNPDLRDHAYTIILGHRAHSDRALRDANQCIGKDATISGETLVTVAFDGTLPPERDPNAFPVLEPPTVILPPQCASCSR